MIYSAIRRKPIHIDPAGEPIRANAWMNLHFLKDGRSFHGCGTYDTEKEARDIAVCDQEDEKTEGDKRLRRGVRMTMVVPWTSPQIEYFYKDYSHHMQAPVKHDGHHH